jgi:hypothetical protein
VCMLVWAARTASASAAVLLSGIPCLAHKSTLHVWSLQCSQACPCIAVRMTHSPCITVVALQSGWHYSHDGITVLALQSGRHIQWLGRYHRHRYGVLYTRDMHPGTCTQECYLHSTCGDILYNKHNTCGLLLPSCRRSLVQVQTCF